MRDAKGQFVKGVSSSPNTQFKKGAKNWRPWKLHRDKAWLENEYCNKRRSASEIAVDLEVTQNAIFFWLHKHGIPRRTISETRAFKKWGLSGDKNGMHGKSGVLNPNWRGGITPARQAIYASAEWKSLSRKVRKRDVCCRVCGSREKTQIHHIDPFSQAPLLVLDIGNVILLCEKCHTKMLRKEKRWKRKLLRILAMGSAQPMDQARLSA